MKYMKNKKMILILSSILVLLIAAIKIVEFRKDIDENVIKGIYSKLSETSSQFAVTIEAYFNEQLSYLTTVADYLSKEDLRSQKIYPFLSDVINNKLFITMNINFPDGASVSHEGRYSGNISGKDYFIRAMKGENVISVVSKPDSERAIIILAVPIVKNGSAVASISAVFDPQLLDKLFGLALFGGDGYVFIAKSDGTILSSISSNEYLKNGNNFLDYIKLNGKCEERYAIIKSQLQKCESSANFINDVHGENIYFNFTKIGINDWYVFSFAPDRIVRKQILGVENSVIDVVFVIGVCVLIVSLLVVKYQRDERNKARLNERCFQALAEQAGRVIFDCDFATMQISAKSNFMALFGRSPLTKSSPEEAINAKMIHQDDEEVFRQLFEKSLRGENSSGVKFRIADNQGVYHWCEVSAIVIHDHRGKPYKAIASLENIEERIRKEESLRQKAEKDSLTGLYNKATTEFLIKEILHRRRLSDDKYALMIIDIDNFKNVNDYFGHLYGDTVLAGLAEQLKHIFRADDIIGRIGGDEFFVFLKNYGKTDLVESKANEICRSFRNDYTENGISLSVSVSIGIALCPEHGVDFEELYQAADVALYSVKEKGKNAYMVYDRNSTASYRSQRTQIDKNAQKNFMDNRIEYVFKLLYDSENPVASIRAVLKLITDNFAFSRGYIFENSDDGQYISNTFEWCAENISSELDKLQKIHISVLEPCLSSLEKTGMFIVKKLEELDGEGYKLLAAQNIRSMLQFEIKNNGGLIGLIGFDDCSKERDFSDEEIEEIGTICHVLGTFLVKHRVSESWKHQIAALSSAIDRFGNPVYVVDMDTQDIIYENRRTCEILGRSGVGLKCYSQYMGMKEQCENCPMRKISENNPQGEADIINNVVGIKVHTVATMIAWNGHKRACLIDCAEITKISISK